MMARSGSRTTSTSTRSDLRSLAAQEIERERAIRCVSRGTMQTAWWRDPSRYVAHGFARSISRECDRWVDDFVNGRGSFVSWHAPPGHGKSEHVGRAMPVRALALRPDRSIIYMTSTEDRAKEVSLAVRSACARLADIGAYPHLARHPDGPWESTLWRTAGGGWWTAVAPGMATGGVDGHGLIMDDVTGSAERQASMAWRNKIERFILEDGLSRMRGRGPKGNMETRRGLDDQTARLHKTQRDVIREVAWKLRAEEGEWDGRAVGEYLWPERFGPAWHADNPHLIPGSALYEGLYQQRPVPEGGSEILADWTGYRYPFAPAETRKGMRAGTVGIFVDVSAKTADRNDPTGVVVIGEREGRKHILHAEEVKPHDLTRYLIDLDAAWHADVIVLEDTSIGPEIKRSLDRARAAQPLHERRLPPVLLQSVAGKGDKVARMEPFKPMWAGGLILLPNSAPWVAAFVAQVTSVPAAPHDDLWDALSLGLAYYADTGAPLEVAPRGRLRG